MSEILKLIFQNKLNIESMSGENQASHSEELTREKSEIMAQMLSMMNENQRKTFDQFESLKTAMDSETNYSMFESGFILGASLMLELMEGKKKMLE